MINDISVLRDNELFSGMSDEDLRLLAPLCSEFVAVEDGLLFTEGRTASWVYLVLKGQIALQRAIRPPHGSRSRRSTVTMCRPGEVVGWSGLVEPYTYTLSALAWESSRLIRIDAKILRKALDRYPTVGHSVMKRLSVVMSRRLRQITEALIDMQEVSRYGSEGYVKEYIELGREAELKPFASMN